MRQARHSCVCRRQRGRTIFFYHRFLERIKAGQSKAFQKPKGGEERISETKEKQKQTASRVDTSIGETFTDHLAVCQRVNPKATLLQQGRAYGK